jgi:hypothetical protein
VNDVERLLALEEIRSLKARYCRTVDARDWDAWRECFTDDIAFYLTSKPLLGVEALLEFGTRYLEGATSVHQVHAPEIAFTSDTEATGIWALHDILLWTEPNMFGVTSMVGYGSYHERYRRVDGTWRISEVKVSRFHVEQS